MAIANIKMTLLCPIEQVWNKVTDLADIQVIGENKYVSISKNEIETYFTVTERIENQSWIFNIENENMKGIWTGKFYSHGDKTTLDFTETIVAKKTII